MRTALVHFNSRVHTGYAPLERKAPLNKFHYLRSVWMALAASLLLVSAASAQTPSLMVDTAPISFTAVQNGPAPAAQVRMVVASNGTAIPFVGAASSTTGWLTVTQSGTTPQNVAIGVGSTALTPGTYQGSVTFSSPGATSTQIQVSLTVTAPGATQVTPSSLSFSYTSGSTAPTTQTLSLAATATAQAFTVSPTASWLTVFPNQGNTSTTGATTVGVGSTRGAGGVGSLVVAPSSGWPPHVAMWPRASSIAAWGGASAMNSR